MFSHVLWTHTIAGGVTLTLNRAAVLALISDLVLESGDQSKPYRYIPMFSADVAPTIGKGASIDVVNAARLQARPLEQLPDSRERYALTARFGYRFEHATLRVDERVYTDTWRLHASTTEVRYIVDLSRRLTMWPRLRAHVQNGAYFWNRAYVASFGPGGLTLPQYRTGDRELGPLFTVTAGLGANYGFGRATNPSAWSLEAQVDVMNTQFADDLYITSAHRRYGHDRRRRSVRMTNARLMFAPMLPLAILVATIGCSDAYEGQSTTLAVPTETAFVYVSEVLDYSCGALDCHGTVGRNLRLYGTFGQRLDTKDVPCTQQTTAAEVDANYRSAVGLEPEIMAGSGRIGRCGSGTTHAREKSARSGVSRRWRSVAKRKLRRCLPRLVAHWNRRPTELQQFFQPPSEPP